MKQLLLFFLLSLVAVSGYGEPASANEPADTLERGDGGARRAPTTETVNGFEFKNYANALVFRKELYVGDCSFQTKWELCSYAVNGKYYYSNTTYYSSDEEAVIYLTQPAKISIHYEVYEHTFDSYTYEDYGTSSCYRDIDYEFKPSPSLNISYTLSGTYHPRISVKLSEAQLDTALYKYEGRYGVKFNDKVYPIQSDSDVVQLDEPKNTNNSLSIVAYCAGGWRDIKTLSYYFSPKTYEDTFDSRVKRLEVGPTTAQFSLTNMFYPIADETPKTVVLNDVDTIARDATTYTLTGLKPNTDYYIFFTVTMEDGCVRYWRTREPYRTPSLELTTLQPVGVSATSSIVAASTNISDIEQNVGFQWKKTSAPDDLAPKEGYAAIYDGRIEGYIKNLQPEYYRVRAFYKDGQGKYYYGDWVAFDPTDFSFFEPTVHTYPVQDLTASTAMLRGYVLPGTEEVKEQGFEYWATSRGNAAPKKVLAKIKAENETDEVIVVRSNGQVMTASLTGLQYDTDYTYRAFVKTTTDKVLYGEEQTFTTPIPTSIDAAESGERTVEGFYDLQGRRIAQPLAKGVTLTRYTDGTVKKTLRR